MANDVAMIAGGVAGLAGAAGAASVGVVLLRRPEPYLASGTPWSAPEVRRPAAPRLAGTGWPDSPSRSGRARTVNCFSEPARRSRGVRCAGSCCPRCSPGPRPAAAGSARDQRVPFRLVVEFAGPIRDAETLLRAYRMLDQQLRDHAPLLSRCVDGRLEPGAVTVRSRASSTSRELLASQRRRYAFADGSFDDIGCRSAPPALVPMISEPWTRRFGWDGREPIPAEERHLLHAMVRGRRTRTAVPCGSRGLPTGSRAARRAVWTELGAAGVDVIADTDQGGLARHLRRHPVRPRSEPPRGPPAVPAAPPRATASVCRPRRQRCQG